MTVTVLVQGERGGYSEQAAREYFDDEIDVLTCPTFLTVVQDLIGDRYAVLPIENTVVGTFAPVADLLVEHEPWIVGEVVMPVAIDLGVVDGASLDDLERVVGYPEMLDRSQTFIEDHDLHVDAAVDTAAAARHVAEADDPATGALAPPLAVQRHGLQPLDVEVQDHPDAAGRLLVIRRFEEDVPDDADKTRLAFVVPDKPGALHDALEVFARRDVNLARLDSRPIPDRPWHYAFQVELDGVLGDDAIDAALRDLAKRTVDVSIFGSYKRAEVD